MSDTITLTIEGSVASKETIAGWEAEVFTLDGAARGADTALPSLELTDDTVLELELANGVRLLVAAKDAHRYLGPAVRGGNESAPGVLTVGQALRLEGKQLPGTLSRDGLGAWIIKGLRVYRHGPAAMTALMAAGSFQDARLEHRNGLYRCSTQRWELSQVDRLPADGEPTLILLHGTASSAEGSFGDLWDNKSSLKQLTDSYQQRIYALEHRSLTESPITNALTLIKTLPKNVRLHLLSHSRGGLVGELLARANRIGAEPFSPEEIARFRDYAKANGLEGFEAQVEGLRELNKEMLDRAIRVERFVRVACPARGTTLASGKLDRWASVMLNLLGKGIEWGTKVLPALAPASKVYDLLRSFLLAVVKERLDAQILPGLEAMSPESPLVALLNAPEVLIDPPLHIVAGDFQGDGLLPWLGDCLSEIFYGGETDLVVNTPSMSGGAMRQQGIRQKSLAGKDVHHLNYFSRNESALPLLAALRGDDRDFTLLSGPSQAIIDRSGKKTRDKTASEPILYLLPGIMGSHLQMGHNRIWFDPINLCAGGMERLHIEAKGISQDGLLHRSYGQLAAYLEENYEVRPFAYDWRLSIVEAAARFGIELDQAINESRQRGNPLRIVAHSMGGLVARLALKDRWEAFKSLHGSRLLQLGTPNQGSHAMATVLLGRDDFTQSIERWFDWKHNLRQFLEIVGEYPGVLELLPWPDEDGKAGDGIDYFDADTWKNLYAQDKDERKEQAWVVPRREALEAARQVVASLRTAQLDKDCTAYVAGRAPTPVAVRVGNQQIEIGWSEEGDGRVPWKTGIPEGVPVWYAEAAHGDLADHQPAFIAYKELLENGTTRQLPQTASGVRGEAAPVFRARGLNGGSLYPSGEEVLAAAIGGGRSHRRSRTKEEQPAVIEVIHGSLASAEHPVLIGAYANDGIRGSARFLDHHLEGRLERAYRIGRYPRQPDDTTVFRQALANKKPAGAIVVGLGMVGELLPGSLTMALTQGLLEYARIMEQKSAASSEQPERLEVCSLLVGTGFAGLTVESGVRCLFDALRRANNTLGQNKLKTRIGRLTIYEEVESRAVAVVQALRELVSEPRFAEVAIFDGRVRNGEGGYCGRAMTGGGQPGLYRVNIEADREALRFTVVTDRARNEVSTEPNQRQAVDGLIRSATRSTMDQPGLSRALFELLVPNSMKEAVADLRTLMLSVDKEAAAYPWELMRDTDKVGEPPLAARIEMVRQLATNLGRGRVPTVREKRSFVVGDTLSGLNELLGAQAEAREIAASFTRVGYEVNVLYRASAQEIFDALFNGQYRFMHLAGHGVVNDKKTGLTGMVLGPATYLTSAQVSKLRRVPEVVFLNCCNLGSMQQDAVATWGQLAANLATEFIQMGCKAVIAAGWAVDDQAASTFARTFYEALFRGVRFGQALLLARQETHRCHPLTNTWGAFQAYGDESYYLPNDNDEDLNTTEYVHPSHLIADLALLSARLHDATDKEKKDYYPRMLKSIEKAARGADFQHAGVRERLARAWSELNEKELAIKHYRAALAFEDAGLSLHGLEQLANLEIRHGEKLISSTSNDMENRQQVREQGQQYMDTGRKRLERLLELGETSERLALMGSYWRHAIQAEIAMGNRTMIQQQLVALQAAYWKAAEHSYKRTGSWDYYPLLNSLDAAFLCSFWQEPAAYERHAPELPALLKAASDNGERRLTEERTYYNALASTDAKRVGSLWAYLDPGDIDERLSNPEVANELVDQYRDIRERFGSSREQESTINQLNFLIKLLPEQATLTVDIRQALQGVIDDILATDAELRLQRKCVPCDGETGATNGATKKKRARRRSQ